MAGNSSRKGAIRKGASKKGPTVGSGGQRRKGLEGKGPTPKASERTGHVAARRASSPAKRESSATRGAGRAGAGGGAAGRRSGGSTEMVAGRNPVVEALRAAVPARALYIASKIDTDDRVREALQLATDRGLPLMEASRLDLDRLTGNAVHQGLALQVRPYTYAHPEDLLERAAEADEVPLMVALDGVTDPRNLGAVVRSVGAFGGHGVIIPERRSAGMTASAWKASAGAAARIPVAVASNLTRALTELKKAGVFVVGLDADGDTLVHDLELATQPLVVVTGSEGAGLSRLVREACDAVVSIPMASGNESLNAGIATGVTLYEVARLRSRR
ncbi:MAG: 23S rRNA (guanosine(2251)-2'-O)-methyltransferase RlmB [Kineosporiaceae bacterium]